MSIVGGLFKGAAAIGKGALWGGRAITESAVGLGFGLAGKTTPKMASTTIGSNFGEWLGGSFLPKAGGLAAGTTYGAAKTGAQIGTLGFRAGAPMAKGLGKALFRPDASNFPLPYTMRSGAKWAVGLGALGLGAGLGLKDGYQQARLGTVHPQGQMNEMSYDAVTKRQDLGASGDLVLALNNMR